MTNADMIRAMTDEELADWLDVMISNCESNNVPCRSFCHLSALSCGDCWLAWIKQEVDDG